MEPPAHDAIQPYRLKNVNETHLAQEELTHHRDQIIQQIKTHIDQANLKSATDLTELAELFPALSTEGTTQINVTQVKQRQQDSTTAEFEDETEPPNDEDILDPDPDEGSSDPSIRNRRRQKGEKPNKPRKKPQETALVKERIIRVNPNELHMTFTTPPNNQGRTRFAIRAAGEQYQLNEETIPLTWVSQTKDLTVQAELERNDIIITAPARTDVELRIGLAKEDANYHSYRIMIKGQGDLTT